ASFAGSNCHEARAGCEVEHAPILDRVRIVQNIASQTLPTCPGKGPEWRWKTRFFEFFLRLVPEVEGLVRKMELYFRHMRRRLQDSICEDEIAGAVRCYHRPGMLFGSRPPIRQTSFHSSSSTGWTERRN